MVVFDMAGTTVDEQNVVYKTLQKAISEAGYTVALDQVLAIGAGQEKLQAIKDVISELHQINDDSIAAKIHTNFRRYLKSAYENLDVIPISGAETVFEVLSARDIQVVLNTGYDQATAYSLLEKLGWSIGQQIDQVVTASDVSKNRPEPDMILLAAERAGISDFRTIAKIGDSQIDIEEGKNAGCGLTVGITTGAQTREQLLRGNPDAVIDKLEDLPGLV